MILSEITKPVNRDELEKGLAPFLTFIASGEPITRKDIAKKLHSTLKRYGVSEVSVEVSDKVDSGDMNMNAAYDPYDDEDELDPFYIELIFSLRMKLLSLNPKVLKISKTEYSMHWNTKWFICVSIVHVTL